MTIKSYNITLTSILLLFIFSLSITDFYRSNTIEYFTISVVIISSLFLCELITYKKLKDDNIKRHKLLLFYIAPIHAILFLFTIFLVLL